jgi:amino-acid N-acetyltransferase
MAMTIDRATPADAPAILALLTASGLPELGVTAHLDTAVVARDADRLVASAALEVYDDGALLRSVAVDASVRGTGVGQRIVHAALALAEERDTPAVYLLTTTAERFFPRFGFERIARADVPPGVRQSVEFRECCCASAVVMRRERTAPAGHTVETS